MMKKCIFCLHQPVDGDPYLEFNNKYICSSCYQSLIPEIYSMAGAGDGGLIHLIFTDLLKDNHNRKTRRAINRYKSTLEKLKHRYKFKCTICGAKEKLTIDHIKPVSKGGSDDLDNLQILCKSCNSKKGNKYND